jgi:hypothetical protein
MSQLVKTKRQANFKDFKRFGAFKGLVEPKNVVLNSFVCKLDLFWHVWAILKRVLKWPTRAKKGPIYTQTRQINYYLINKKYKINKNQNLIVYYTPRRKVFHSCRENNSSRDTGMVLSPRFVHYLNGWHIDKL